MPYDPNFPPLNAPLVSAQWRNQFQGLKALIDAAVSSLVPVGAVIPWHKDLPGLPALPANFVECNGQVLNDPESPIDGVTIPNYNGEERFIRAGTTSGQTGGISSFGLANADANGGGTVVSVVSPDFSPGAVPHPPYATFVFVMRVK